MSKLKDNVIDNREWGQVRLRPSWPTNTVFVPATFTLYTHTLADLEITPLLSTC